MNLDYKEKRKIVLVLTNTSNFDFNDKIKSKDYIDYIKRFDYNKEIINKDLSEYNIIPNKENDDVITYKFNSNMTTHVYTHSVILTNMTLYGILESIMLISKENDKDFLIYCHTSVIDIESLDTLIKVLRIYYSISIIQIVENLSIANKSKPPHKDKHFILFDYNNKLKMQYIKSYDASVVLKQYENDFDKNNYQLIDNTTENFSQIYYNHVSKVKSMMYRIINSFDYNSHDYDKMYDSEIFNSYNDHYVELKKIPYLDENGNRNKEYEDYENTYMHYAMSKHCMLQKHHYYDWKNLHEATLMDMIEAIVDIYISKTQYHKKDEVLDLEEFNKMLYNRNVTKLLGDKIAKTITLFSEDGIEKKFTEITDYDCDIYHGKEALNYIKNKNDVLYDYIINSISYLGDNFDVNLHDINFLKIDENGKINFFYLEELFEVDNKSLKGELLLYKRKEDEKLFFMCKTQDDKLHNIVFI